MKDSAFERGVMWMLLSATCLSLAIFFVKILLDYYDFFFLLFLRFFIPLIFVSLVMLVWHREEFFSKTSIKMQIARCLCILVSQYSITYFMTKNTVLNATVLLNASPLFIPLLEWIFQGHKPAKSTILGALLAFCGVILILRPDSSLFSPMSGIGLLGALGQAGSQILYGPRAKTEKLWGTVFYLFFFTSIMTFIIYLFTDPIEEISKDSIVITSLILMGLATLLNQFFRGLSYRYGRPSTMATFLYFAVFISALLDWVFFNQIPTTLTIIGSLLVILGGVVKVYLRAHFLKKK